MLCRYLIWVWLSYCGCGLYGCAFTAQTLCALFRAIFQKRMGDLSFDAIDTIVGFDAAECQMKVRGDWSICTDNILLCPHRILWRV